MKTAKLNRDEVRENTITIPMTKAEKEAISSAAQKIGLSMSAFVRMVINKELARM